MVTTMAATRTAPTLSLVLLNIIVFIFTLIQKRIRFFLLILPGHGWSAKHKKEDTDTETEEVKELLLVPFIR